MNNMLNTALAEAKRWTILHAPHTIVWACIVKSYTYSGCACHTLRVLRQVEQVGEHSAVEVHDVAEVSDLLVRGEEPEVRAKRVRYPHRHVYCGVDRCFFFFFFQAEDGIRDYKVTGVQTCALPI